MEESISGSRTAKNTRPTITSYMYGNAQAISKIAELAGDMDLSEKCHKKAIQLKDLVQKNLWDNDAKFFKVRFEDGQLSDAREAIGFIPWYLNCRTQALKKRGYKCSIPMALRLHLA